MRNQKFVSVVLSVTLSFLGVAVIAYGATTIGTSITTTGDIATATASSTGQVKLDNLVVGQVSAGATISSAGAIIASSTLKVYGAATLAGALSVTGATTLSTASSTGLVTISSLKMGAASNLSTFTGMTAGYCTIATVSPTASSTAYAECAGATGVVAGDRIMVMATSSLPMNFVVRAASSTAADIINLQILNVSFDGTAATGINSFNFVAFR